ncbi:MAG: hypothetical protein AB1609_09405 [Bacillota bacterium]
MAELIPMDGEVRRRAERKLILRRVSKRLDTLERLWYTRSREEIAAELAEIGHELLDNASLFLPPAVTRAMENFEKPPDPGSYPNGHVQTNGQPRPRQGEVNPSTEDRWEALADTVEELAEELETVLRQLRRGEQPAGDR